MDAQLPVAVNSSPAAASRPATDVKSVKSSATKATSTGKKTSDFNNVMADVTSQNSEDTNEGMQQSDSLIAGLNSGVVAILMQMQAATVAQDAATTTQTVTTQTVNDSIQAVVPMETLPQGQLANNFLAGNAQNAAQLLAQAKSDPTANTAGTISNTTGTTVVVGQTVQNLALTNQTEQPNAVETSLQENQLLAGKAQEAATAAQTLIPASALVSKQTVQTPVTDAQSALSAQNAQMVGTQQSTAETEMAQEDADSVLVPVVNTKAQLNPETLQQQTKNEAGLFSQTKDAVQSDKIDKTQSTDIGQNVFASLLEQRSNSATQPTGLSAEQPANQAPSTDAHNIGTQIVDKVQLLKSAENSQIVIQLKPEHLGELSLKVAVNNGVVSASFHSDNPEVRSIIEASIAQLKQEFSNQGLKVDNVGIYAGLGQFLSEGQQRETAQYPTVKIRNKKAEEEAFQELDAIEGPIANDATDSGVDYRV